MIFASRNNDGTFGLTRIYSVNNGFIIAEGKRSAYFK